MPHEQKPYVIVYQNADFVGSLYQSETNDGLPNTSQYETSGTSDQSRTGTNKGQGSIKAGGNIPGVAKLEGTVGGGKEVANKDGQTSTRRHRVEMSRDTALYLHVLHERLDKLTTTVSSNSDGAALDTGSLVKFHGRFRPDPISALLDLGSPDAVAEMTRFATRQGKRAKIVEEDWDIDKVKVRWELVEQEATTKADLARTITEAVHTDFRRKTTTELHCKIDSSLTALVVCEAEHFVTADPDRPLDGDFTVFGKVVTKPEQDVPIFRKNKLLSRMNHEWVKYILSEITNLTEKSVNGEAMPGFLRDETEGKVPPPFNLDFPAIIEGYSFTVLPIAIYA
ncbi:DUF6414 family protein [Amycolatopsis sp. NBC_01286]|uniref:DUF6414 family protein n=1 Tax=Amycolatopsis sp. NBC_01286 TaxID=2903560 RepID=UPI002E112D56|nr:hypothetical protein OG570_16960 [Amycolatopsis sp. NBC_01286]